jgi:hypothetical protein
MTATNTAQSLTSAKAQRNLDPRRRLMKGQPLNPNAAAILRYQRELEALVRQMVATYEREIRKFLKKPVAREYFAADESVSSQAKILMTELAKRFFYPVRHEGQEAGRRHDRSGVDLKRLVAQEQPEGHDGWPDAKDRHSDWRAQGRAEGIDRRER